MGRFIASSTQYSQLRANVNDVHEDIDVFVSHKSDDKDKAEDVARCIVTSGLSVWIDTVDIGGTADDIEMVRRIETAIARASSLIAVVTQVTNESWWVPFEIGLAYEKEKQLASYCESPHQVEFPSFLWSWPLVQNHNDLHKWCRHVKATKSTYPRSSISIARARVDDRQSYRDSLSRIRNELRFG